MALQPETPLYRYVSFDRFLDIVFNNHIVAVSPSKWDDSYEQYWLHYLKSIEGESRLTDYVRRDLPKKEDYEYVSRQIKGLQKMVCNNIYAICFSAVPDKELMWRANSVDKKTIMFSTTISTVRKLAEENGYYCPHIERIQYDLEERCGFDEYLKHLSIYDRNAVLADGYELFTHKREIFKYEEEVRLIIEAFSDTPGSGKLQLNISNLNSFITGVMVHPGATEGYCKLIEMICKQYDLKFLGRSSIYDYEVLR